MRKNNINYLNIGAYFACCKKKKLLRSFLHSKGPNLRPSAPKSPTLTLYFSF